MEFIDYSQPRLRSTSPNAASPNAALTREGHPQIPQTTQTSTVLRPPSVTATCELAPRALKASRMARRKAPVEAPVKVPYKAYLRAYI